jgi:Vitamin K-dependent gamma-carboxylase
MPRQALKRLVSWWLTPMPAQRLALLRLALGALALGYLVIRAPHLVGLAEFPARQFQPVGLCAALTEPLPASLVMASVVLALLAGVAFVAGLGFALSGPAFALSFLWVTTYRSSFGMVFHTENLLALHLLLLGASRAADALSVDERRRNRTMPTPSAEYGWPVRALCLVTVLAYVLAGVAKLKLAGGPWLEGELLRRQIAYDNLRKLELGTEVSPLGPWLVRHRAVFPVLAVATMLVELGAPLALVRARVAKAWVAAAWGFHVGVLLFMSIGFFYQLSGFAYLSFFPVERGWQWLLARRRPDRP